MNICYPAILLFYLAVFEAIKVSRVLWWKAGLVFGSIPLFFALVSYVLCKKGYTKLAWMTPLISLIFTGVISAAI